MDCLRHQHRQTSNDWNFNIKAYSNETALLKSGVISITDPPPRGFKDYNSFHLLKSTLIDFILNQNKLTDHQKYLHSGKTIHSSHRFTYPGTSSHQILLLSAHAYRHFAWELQSDSQCVHHGVSSGVLSGMGVYALAGGSTCMSVHLLGM